MKQLQKGYPGIIIEIKHESDADDEQLKEYALSTIDQIDDKIMKPNGNVPVCPRL